MPIDLRATSPSRSGTFRLLKLFPLLRPQQRRHRHGARDRGRVGTGAGWAPAGWGWGWQRRRHRQRRGTIRGRQRCEGPGGGAAAIAATEDAQGPDRGAVLIQAIIRKDGTVDNFKVLRGLGHGLDESAIKTIASKWRFRPGTLNGVPVDVQANIEVFSACIRGSGGGSIVMAISARKKGYKSEINITPTSISSWSC